MNKRTRGFTLMEILTAMALMLIALCIGMPSFSQMLDRHRELAASNEMLAQLALARTWAISRGEPIALCPSTNRRHCDPGFEWSGSWIIYADPDGNRQPDRSSDILTMSPAPGGGRLRILSSAGRVQMRYLPDGRAAGSNLTFRLCNHQTAAAEVVVSATGRARSVRLADRPLCGS
ncbi:GspH/FimT family pseudopilin [Xanthomonas sp. AM6]|uniref:GspH/FimT family pseudopilin n=1 Tax=Xanthomonas sp. AM6 TaxID=2982531 RepID=UPI0021D7E610|nr:GspH/FimT family pseudopilin [Xanthomonas sp. AM6]UYB53888.1 GspH/FimT family pseudopilin [Xanthomonas sp. AM6]